MFKLGEYHEDIARSIVKYLKDAKIKVEQKTYICAETETAEYIEGKLSDLRGEVKDIETYVRYLSALKTALAKGPTPDDFRDLFLSELDPAWLDRKDKFAEIFKDPTGLSDEGLVEASEKLRDGLDTDELKALSEWIFAFDFALSTLSCNDVEPGEDIGDRLNDPILRIRVDSEDYQGDKPIKSTVSVELEKQSELFIDEFTSPLFEELDDEFQEDYPDEYLQIMALGLLITDLVEEPSTGKIEMQAFADRCDLEMENDGDILKIDGTYVAEEIAKVLEKNGIIKLKGETIKWKNLPKEENR
jgi:hypothetical protein